MAISRELYQNLINDQQVIITPYNAGDLVNNYYQLHNNGNLRMYETMYAENTTIDTENPPKQTEIAIPKTGYVLEPSRIYYMTLQEIVTSPKYTMNIVPHPDLGQFGLTINCDASSGEQLNVTLTSTHPIKIYPKQVTACLYLEEGDTGTGSVPIGAILAWGGGEIPYGFCICDGSNGSPDLTGQFIRGSTSNREVNATPLLDNGSGIYDLVFIMRYK